MWARGEEDISFLCGLVLALCLSCPSTGDIFLCESNNSGYKRKPPKYTKDFVSTMLTILVELSLNVGIRSNSIIATSIGKCVTTIILMA